jgi:hypothetical protein
MNNTALNAAVLAALEKSEAACLKTLKAANRNRLAALRYFDSVPARDEVEKENALSLYRLAEAAHRAARSDWVRASNKIATFYFNAHSNPLAK